MRTSAYGYPFIPADKLASIRKRYDRMWDKAIGSRGAGRVKATLLVLDAAITSGYRSSRNEIILGIATGLDLDLVPATPSTTDLPSTPPPDGYPIWERDLHHEFVHEYEDKIVAGNVTPEGAALAADQTLHRHFEPDEHGEVFHTAALELAQLFGIDPRLFIEAL